MRHFYSGAIPLPFTAVAGYCPLDGRGTLHISSWAYDRVEATIISPNANENASREDDFKEEMTHELPLPLWYYTRRGQRY